MNGSSPLDGWFLVGAAIGYLLASVGYDAHLLLRQSALARYGRVAAWTAVGLHTAAIGLHCAVTRQTPFTTPADTLSASAWAIALAYLVLELLLRPKPVALGAVALPAAFLCLFSGAVLHSAANLHLEASLGSKTSTLLNSRIISLHVIALLFAFALLVLAFGSAAFYLWQDFLLKHKRVVGGLFGKLPSLADLEQLGFTLVSFAFPLLTLGLGAGIIRAVAGGLPGNWEYDKKVLASVVTWIVYGLYLMLHRLAHWRGPRANYLLLGGLAAALITYFIPTQAHQFG